VTKIEFPSILLPPNIVSGSIVDITVARNHAAEAESDKQFAALQDRIFSTFGAAEPSTPVLRCRNATQTSILLEWDPIELATADLISLSLYRNGQKAGNIPRPLKNRSTKISGLAVDTEYTFHLVLRTSAGTLSSKQIVVRTHKMTDLSGVTITTGFLPSHVRETLTAAVERIGAKFADSVGLDTTHFITTEGRGIAWEKAVEMNIPVVRPEWATACEESGRILGVTKFYLDTLRGPPNESPSTTTAQSPARTQKELPAAPHSAQNGGSKSATSGEKKEDNTSNEGEAKRGVESNGAEEKVKTNADEQKVRLEEKGEQKVAIRSGKEKQQTLEGYESPDNDEKAPTPSPGDGASFQDVAL
jgi:chitin biosynthesis protein CHS5